MDMNSRFSVRPCGTWTSALLLFVLLGATVASAQDKNSALAQAADEGKPTANTSILPSLEEARKAGALHSIYRNRKPQPSGTEKPEPNLDAYRKEIEPILKETCFGCHGPTEQEGEFRVDTLDPDLTHGQDVDWWLEVVRVLSNGEMPPEDD